MEDWEFEFSDPKCIYKALIAERAKSDRLYNALNYVYESGYLRNEADEKARWGLGLEVENETEVSAMQSRT
ncbi:hypothetical protein [Photobacterium leiognathi]|uniref:hypothetical protein n=1 Tax=Photobacterium leiognathi TaxID=553611 RepID=UPI0029825B61|nr:hypothetical protein [Photobacterium leiognathi]